MASYKVAQDVEAEDKLLGPFTLRQFIYLIIAAMAGVVAYGLSQLFLPLFVIPLPIILFFVVLALPLRKDQPMEVYLAALVSFYIKPRKRVWQPDGIESMIEITAPKSDEPQLTKEITSNEAQRRLAYLATLADTQGWSIRNATAPTQTSMVSDVYNEARSFQSDFDDNGSVAQAFDTMIDQADAERRQSLIDTMQHHPHPTPPSQPTTTTPVSAPEPEPTPAAPTPTTDNTPTERLTINPYPTNMRQRVIHPEGDAPEPVTPTATPTPMPKPPSNTQPPANDPQATSVMSVSPDIISLAHNNDLSVETIAREARRIEQKRKDNEEVVISLR